jgi:hypothetical protein
MHVEHSSVIIETSVFKWELAQSDFCIITTVYFQILI